MSLTNFLKTIALMLFIVFAVPAVSGAMNTSNNLTIPVRDSLADAKTAATITQRVYEIQAMDKTNLSPAERKSLRKELREMKAQADELNHRVYLSIGAIIIIILLLIIIL